MLNFKAMIEHLPETTCVYLLALDGMGTPLYVGPQISSFGYSQKEILENPGLWYSRIHPEDSERVFDEYRAQHLKPFRCEYRVFTRDGRIVWVRDEGKTIKDEDGKPLFMGVIQDITEYKKGQAALRQSEERLLRSQRFAKMGNWDWDLVKDEVYWSDELYDIFGLKLGSPITYKTFLDFVHPDDVDKIEKAFRESIEERKPFGFFYRIIRSDGYERQMVSEGEITFDSNGKPVSVAGAAQDITERRKVEKKFHEAEQKFRFLVEKSLFPIFIFDFDSKRVKYANSAGLEFLGYSFDEISSLSLPDLIDLTDMEAHERDYNRFKAEGFIRIPDRTVVKKDGTRKHIEVSSFSIESGGERIMIGIWYDLTEQKKNQAKLVQNADELKFLNEELHRLTVELTRIEANERKRFAELLHEGVGQNLVALKMIIESASRKCGNMEAGKLLGSSLEIIENSIRSARDMILDLYPAPIKEMRLDDALRWYIDRIMKNSANHVELDLDHVAQLLVGNEDVQRSLFLIIRESLQNSFKYAPGSRVTVTFEHLGEMLRLRITDNGPGFSCEIGKDVKRGIGLKLMREWAMSIGGELAINSSPGVGVEILVEFPVFQSGRRQA